MGRGGIGGINNTQVKRQVRFIQKNSLGFSLQAQKYYCTVYN